MSLIIGIVGACVAIITEQSIVIQILSIPAILLAIIATPLVGNYIKYVYPYREIPSYNDKQYTKKMFEMSDEGERHIMLQGLYSAFNNEYFITMFLVTMHVLFSRIRRIPAFRHSHHCYNINYCKHSIYAESA